MGHLAIGVLIMAVVGVLGYRMGSSSNPRSAKPGMLTEIMEELVDELGCDCNTREVDPVELQVITEFRKWFGKIAYGITLFHKTRNAKRLSQIGRDLRPEYTWMAMYLEERKIAPGPLQELYVALEAGEHTLSEDYDGFLDQVIDLSIELETAIEDYAASIGIGSVVKYGYVNRLIGEVD